MQLKSKDRHALEYLYDHYSSAVYGIVVRIVEQEDIAEELLQDIFLKIWNRIDQYDVTKGRLFTWILNIARNMAIDKLRSKELGKSRKTNDIDDYVHTIDRAGHTTSDVDTIGLTEVLKTLSDEQRFVVEYLYLKGYTQSELAEEFNIPLGTIKTRLRLAMQHLRVTMNVT